MCKKVGLAWYLVWMTQLNKSIEPIECAQPNERQYEQKRKHWSQHRQRRRGLIQIFYGWAQLKRCKSERLRESFVLPCHTLVWHLDIIVRLAITFVFTSIVFSLKFGYLKSSGRTQESHHRQWNETATLENQWSSRRLPCRHARYTFIHFITRNKVTFIRATLHSFLSCRNSNQMSEVYLDWKESNSFKFNSNSCYYPTDAVQSSMISSAMQMPLFIISKMQQSWANMSDQT